MGIFSFLQKKTGFLGVDLGSGGVKLVELRSEKNRTRLFTYGFTERDPDHTLASLLDSPDETAAVIKKVAEKAKIGVRKAVAAVPGSSVISSVITVPVAGERETKAFVENQVQKLVSAPITDMVLDYKKLSASLEDEKTKTVRVFVTAAAKGLTAKYLTIFKKAGLELTSLETEPVAVIRSLIGKDRGTAMIVDLGAIRTTVTVVDENIPFLTRTLDLGGIAFTRALSRIMAVDLGAAEQMKFDLNALGGAYLDGSMPEAFRSAVAPLITELRYSMELFKTSSEGKIKTVEKIILTGGSASIPGLVAYVSQEVGLKTYVGDPWARISTPVGLKKELDLIGPRFAVAIGLAMRDF